MGVFQKASLSIVPAIATLCLMFFTLSALGADYQSGVSATVLKSSSVTGNGQRIVYPVTDKAEVTAMTVNLAPGAETGWHSHPIPVYAYVVEGTLDVELEGGQVITYRSGDAIIEVVNTLHNGRNQGSEEVRLVVFYTGAEGTPNVVKPAALLTKTVAAATVGDSQALPTLDGQPPLLIGHRGASGYLPEHTLEAYQLAITQGADVLEPDLISTKDGVLIARHDPNLITSTDVASRPEFADRKRVDWPVDGEKQTGWFAHDFTLAEIKTLGTIITDPERPQQNNGKFRIATLQEIIDLVKAQNTKLGRTILVYPETKNPSYHRDLGLPLEGKLIATLNTAGWNSPSAPVFVQSFEPGSLVEMRSKGLKTRMVQLVDGDDIDLKDGKITYAIPFERPYDWCKSGDTRLFADMVTPAGLAEIRTYADGIGVWKPYIVPVKGQVDAAGQLVDGNGDGKVDLRDAATQPPTSLVTEAHKQGLFVHVFTFRNEKRRLASSYRGDPQAEYLQFFRLGVDGVFSEFPDTAVMARAAYLREGGR